MNIEIEKYLSDEEIKAIIIDIIKTHVKDVVGNVSVSNDKSRVLISKLAKDLAKEGVQEIIPNFTELLNEHIKTEIAKLTLTDFFWESFGWQTRGNKIINSILSENKALIDAKVKEIFKKLE